MPWIEDALIVGLIVFNLLAGLGGAVAIARLMNKINNKRTAVLRYILMLIGIYFVECVAFSAGMATQIFTVGLAFIWGIVFGLWLRKRTSVRMALKTALWLALYGCLPTTSFCVLIPMAMPIGGWNIFSAAQGAAFGIPDVLPWPTNTIMGFCAALLIGTAILKTVITAGVVRLLIHLGQKSTVDGSQTENSPLDVERSKAT